MTDSELIDSMAEDLSYLVKGDHEGETFSHDELTEILKEYWKPGEVPTEDNIHDNYCTFGVWVCFDGGMLYQNDFPAFDKALELKDPKLAKKLNKVDPGNYELTLSDCKRIYNALDDMFAAAVNKLIEHPYEYFDELLEEDEEDEEEDYDEEDCED